MADKFEGYATGLDSPGWESYQPVDGVEFPDGPCRGVHCNTAGTVVGQLGGDSADKSYTLVAGLTYGLRFKEITTGAANVVALY